MRRTKQIFMATALTLALVGCKENNEKSDKKDAKMEQNHDAKHNKDHHGKHHDMDSTKTANDYMHQSNTEELIERFESPERDAYQKPELVLEYLGDIKDKTIMDIGAGSGYFSVKLAEPRSQCYCG